MYNTFGLNDMHALVQDMNSPQHNFAEDLQQALGVDAFQLENQWRISLHQPVIQGLDTGILASHPARKSLPTPSLTDSNAPLWLTLGILLIVLPLCGLIALFTYQHRVLYPMPSSNERQNQTIDEFLPLPFVSGQEYGNRPPTKQA
jgi:hypothetical protein